MTKELRSSQAKALKGRLRVPGDKSISHRSLMLASLAIGETTISGLLEGEDVLATAKAMQAMGADITKSADGQWRVRGRGVGGLAEPEEVLDLGNAGTATRLLMGLTASHRMLSFMTGDRSLRSRPMNRVIAPLTMMGAEFLSRDGHLPLAVIGSDRLRPLEYRLPVPSAQVKSAVLLAGLNCRGTTSVIETEATRDHTENMLRHFGATIALEDHPDGRIIQVQGYQELTARDIKVPGDISSAAFPLVAALLVPDSDLLLEHIGLNPHRIGLLETLGEMGALIELQQQQEEGGEKTGHLRVRSSRLKGVTVPAARAASMIDEYPILAMAAACAEGTSTFTGLKELRVKESDRLANVARGLAQCGVAVEEGPDRLVIHGKGKPPKGGADIAAELDHRIAMSFLVLGMVTKQAIKVDDQTTIATSFPGFVPLMNGLGAALA